MQRYTVERTGSFKRDQKLIRKRRYKEEKLAQLVALLAAEEALPVRYRNHKLIGNYANHWECHIEPDWLLIYRYEEESLILVRTGTHADLFE